MCDPFIYLIFETGEGLVDNFVIGYVSIAFNENVYQGLHSRLRFCLKWRTII